MSNPFDSPDGLFLVLLNDERQHSLWPSFLAVPGGWRVATGPAPKPDCMAYIETHWPDITPASLRGHVPPLAA